MKSRPQGNNSSGVSPNRQKENSSLPNIQIERKRYLPEDLKLYALAQTQSSVQTSTQRKVNLV